MARQPRYLIPHIPAHIGQRGNNRTNCFLDDHDKAIYISKLHELCLRYKVALHSFVLMSNHVHFLASPCDKVGISKLMHALGSFYVRYFNKKYERTGTLWEGRFWSSLVQTESYFLTLSRYIELNPVRAGLVSTPEEYHWSSYQGNALGKSINLLTAHPVYLAMGRYASERQKRYRALFKTEIPEETIVEIRKQARKSLPVGDEDFIARMEKILGSKFPCENTGGDRKSENFKKSKEKIKGSGFLIEQLNPEVS